MMTYKLELKTIVMKKDGYQEWYSYVIMINNLYMKSYCYLIMVYNVDI